MQFALKVFETQEREQFRIIDRDGEPWFVAKDVASILGYSNPQKAIRDHCKAAEKVGVNETFTLDPQTIVIPERDLYRLIIRSKLPTAERFEEWVFGEVLPSIRKTGGYQIGRGTPVFIARYSANWDKPDTGYFSVINELVVQFWGRLEHAGYILADRAPNGKEIRPDNAVGRRFSDHLKEHHPELIGGVSYCHHETPEWQGPARQYPLEMLGIFRRFVDEVWIPNHAAEYLATRDPAALPYLQKLLPSPDKPKIGMMRNPANSRFRRLKKAG